MQTTGQTASGVSIQRSGDRMVFDHGWLKTYHSFSFAEYFDPHNLSWGALRVFNDDTVAPGQGFGTHDHRDMEILTYVLDGELAHRDSMGNERVVAPGAVQYLSAGTGISHSEYNHSKVDPVHFVQMWVLPRRTGLKPQYGQVDFTAADRRDRWLTVASGEPGVEAPIAIWQDATAKIARIESARLTHEIKPGRFGFLFVADGTAQLGTDELVRGDAARILGPLRISVSGAAELVLWDVPKFGGR
ncbi:MAG: pirin family protein [Vulcanimicrobiaceae bacterium]